MGKSEYHTKHYQENKEKYNKRSVSWRDRNLERDRKNKREWARRNREKKGRAWELKKDFGITIQDYNFMFDKQNGCCAICDTHQSELSRRLCVDHCHDTGRVRGLLCNTCNRALGLFKDDSAILLKANRYLKMTEAIEVKSLRNGK